MANNMVQCGDRIDVTAPSGGATSGKGLLIGTMFGVAALTVAQGDVTPIILEGVFKMDKATGEAWSVGAAIYWDNTAKKMTTTSSGNTKVGVATVAALSADTTGVVRLNAAF
ncbi:DUF2190 family protein [Prosthecomicrobium hirschii]|uniref:DUF2190 family protein n=1 Tax=Prosthecodimorpha hirschii TaxID=665126 RepID=UPI00221E93BE|nr:DUF2190 family protein [Prosthecomicrobium hirschii]MCW1839445.1 DUF2190 family protein [Prosthecomicrobium hirschii]